MHSKLNFSRVSIGVALLFGMCGVASADAFAWAIDGSADLNKIDLDTGATTTVGNTGQVLGGLGTSGFGLYASSYFTAPELFKIDTTNGNLDPIGPLSVGLDVFGSTTSGLYGIGADWNLYKIDPTSGAETLVGATGLTTLGDYAAQLSSGGTDLYLARQLGASDEEIDELSTTDGTVTILGDVSGPFAIAALTFVGGSLYSGGYFSPYDIEQVDLGSLSGTHLANAQMPSSFWGLAPLTTPSPAAAIPFVLGALAHRKRRAGRS